MNINCKACGAPLVYQPGEVLVSCSCCGMEQSVPANVPEEIVSILNRANTLRMQEQFEDAQALYEGVLVQNEKLTEALWGLELANYGVLFSKTADTARPCVELKLDQQTSITNAPGYLAAMETAPADVKKQVGKEAELIQQIWDAQQQKKLDAPEGAADTFIGIRTGQAMSEEDARAVCNYVARLGYDVSRIPCNGSSYMERDALEKRCKKAYLLGQVLLETGNLSAALEAFRTAIPYQDAVQQVKILQSRINVQKAQEPLDAGDVYTAYHLLKELQGNEEADALLESDALKAVADELNAIEQQMKHPLPRDVDERFRTGNTVTMGNYVQLLDENNKRQKASISWVVLAREGNQALLISQQVIACLPYNREAADLTWEHASLRRWLNNEFLSWAFTREEAAAIVPRMIHTPCHPQHGTDGGNPVADRLFALSHQEVERYFPHKEQRKAVATDIAVAAGCWVNPEGQSWWWLRNAGKTPKSAGVVCSTGDIFFYHVNNYETGVRPAMWVNLQAGFFRK